MYISFLNLWRPCFLRQTCRLAFVHGVLISSAHPARVKGFSCPLSHPPHPGKGKEDPKSFLTGGSGDSHQIPFLSRFNSAKVNFHANIRCSDANKSHQRVCHKNINAIMQNANKNQWWTTEKRRMSKENRLFIPPSDLMDVTARQDKIKESTSPKNSCRVEHRGEKVPMYGKIFCVLFLYLWGIKYGSSHLSTPFFLIFLLCRVIDVQEYYLSPNILFFPARKLRSLQRSKEQTQMQRSRYFVFFRCSRQSEYLQGENTQQRGKKGGWKKEQNLSVVLNGATWPGRCCSKTSVISPSEQE